jgi:hypothetical protein
MVFFGQQAIFASSSFFFTLLGLCASLPFYASLFYTV